MTIHSASRERLATDLSREGCTLVLLNGFQQIFGFLEGVLRSSTQSIERRRIPEIFQARSIVSRSYREARQHRMNPSTHDLGGSTGVRSAGARGWQLLLSLMRRRSIQRSHLAENVLLSRTYRLSYGQIGQARWSLTLGQANEIQIGIRYGPA
jgi:hypothetical protein